MATRGPGRGSPRSSRALRPARPGDGTGGRAGAGGDGADVTSPPARQFARRGSVTFDTQVSAYPPDPGEEFEQLELREEGERILDEEELVLSDEVKLGRAQKLFHALIEERRARHFFRACAVVNILSLIFSAPLIRCDNEDETCTSHFVTFIVITTVDLVLSVLYSIHTIARMEYAFYLYRKRKYAKIIDPDMEMEDGKLSDYNHWVKIVILNVITLSLWASVAIGFYRSVEAWPENGRSIEVWCYLFFVPRSLAIFSAMKLFVPFKLHHSALWELVRNIKWKQLFYVAVFYLFFIYMFALLGVQWIGGLNKRCVYTDNASMESLAIPVTHCNDELEGVDHSCYSYEPNITCEEFPDGSDGKNIDFRNQVYFGQFRFIADALFAIYEASSWELWSLMQYTALDGASRSRDSVLFLYVTMVIFLVIFVQQSIFLVVIIESFADLRSGSTIRSTPKRDNKPHIVLCQEPGASSGEKLRLHSIKPQEYSTHFNQKLNKYYFRCIEKVFLVLVLLDAAITAIKHTGMKEELAVALQSWQMTVSILFLLEILGLLLFHLFSTNQHKLFFKNSYYWYLMILGVGGVVAAIPHNEFYNPLVASRNAIVIFQALRLPRLLRLSTSVKKFFFKILGDGTRLLVVILMTLVFLVWFSVVSMQFFGYLEPEEACEMVSGGQFNNFFFALQSMFQLVMQEGWTELMGDVMCRRPGFQWWIINFYFIVVHLFASLILLNFFVAVILDNLDYDEEKKKTKLEEDLQKRKIEKVPHHLKLVKHLGGAKRVPVPKLSSATGIEAPCLTEAEVRNFYDTGEAVEFPVTSLPSEHHPITHQHDGVHHRQSLELTSLSLLSGHSSEVLSSDVPTHRDKYRGIQGILNHIKAVRQHSREQEGTRPTLDSLGGGGRTFERGISGQLDTSSLVQSEYDEYREKYRLFDSALFCMPPDHKLRKTCQSILTSQLGAPKENPSDIARPDQLQKIVKNRIVFILRYLISRLPYFTWLMVFITCGTIATQIYELYTTNDHSKPYPSYVWPMDLVFVLFTLVELILKILANGFFLNPNAAIHSLWDVLDWMTVLATFATMITYLSLCGPNPLQDVSLRHIPIWMTLFLVFRAMRPLRLISLIPSMRRVIWDVILGWRKFFLGLLLLFFFIYMFASLGVQLFAGDDPEGPQGFCSDPNMKNLNECVGEFYINLKTSREIIPGGVPEPRIWVPRVWYRHRRDFPFDNMWQALITLFEVLTLEGWLDVRDMLKNMGGWSETPAAWYMSIYIHIYVFFGVNLGLQLFVGIVVNNFNEHKPDHSALLTVSQKRWTDLVQRISLTRPIKRPREPRHSRFRLLLYKVVVSRYYRHMSSAVILLNSFMLASPWVNDLRTLTKVLMSFTIFFSCLFIIELCVKMLAFGPRKGYFHSWRNVLDFFIGFLYAGFVICAILYLAGYSLDLNRLADYALVLAILKCFTILGKYSVLQNLTITVGQTFFKTIPLTLVFMVTVVTYAFIGNIFFSQVRTGEAINYSNVNFDGSLTAMGLVLRVTTGEDWHHLLWDSMVQEPYCSEAEGNCGNRAAAVIWFISYYVLVTFIFINIIIAVLLENFSIFYNEDDTELSHAVVKDFRQNWYFFDKDSSGSIPAKRIKLFLRMLRLQKLFTFLIDDNGVKERRMVRVLSEPLLLREMAEELSRDLSSRQVARGEALQSHEDAEGGKKFGIHSFQSVLKMLAYRAEDIHQRLEPQELYVREELEESVQYDVAEDCILKWLQRFVKPVIIRQEKHRRQTVYRRPTPAAQREKSVMWSMAELTVADAEIWQDRHSQQSVDTDDEPDSELMASLGRRGLQQSLQHYPSIDEVDNPAGEGEDQENPLLAKSYAKLERALVHGTSSSGLGASPGAGAGTLGEGATSPSGGLELGRDKWHDWFKMQKEWMNKVEEDPENYFDDYL